jgi:phosphopantetheine adenylyltransferase/predicted metal-dependent HD superfamily phosphohydrolase
MIIDLDTPEIITVQ